MPFQFPEQISNWLERRNAKAKIEQLMSTMTELTNLSQGKDDALKTLLKKHLLKAEEEYQSALVEYKDDIEACKRLTEFGLFRLDLAKQQLSVAQEKNFVPNFEENTPEHGALMLSAAIARTKMAVEYSNCVVSESIRTNLVGVVTMFNDAVDMLRTGQPEMSQRTSEGGLLMLYLLERQIELDNRQSIVDLKNIPKFTTRESKKIKEAVDCVCNFQHVLLESQKPVSSRITKHLDGAVENFYAAVQAYVDNEIELIDKLTVTVRMQVDLSEKLYHSNITKKVTPSEAQEEEEEYLNQRITEFKTRVLKIHRLAQHHVENPDPISKKLEDAFVFYQGAIKALHDCDMVEATRLTEAARLDLDFAKQLLFDGKAIYRDE
ncbi:MAG TPA: hypothetical protein V6C86_20750 [Oculatellaceae cyanobacterium]